MIPIAIRPAPALTANVREIRWNCGVRSISRHVKLSPPAPATSGGMNPSGSQPSGGITIQIEPMRTSDGEGDAVDQERPPEAVVVDEVAPRTGNLDPAEGTEAEPGHSAAR